MTIADRIGLLPGFGAIFADHTWWLTLLICWAVTPGLMFVIAPLFESRWLPVNPRRQFLSFFPGDFFLGIMVTVLLVAPAELPEQAAWYNSLSVHIAILAVCIACAVFMTVQELRSVQPASLTMRQASYSRHAILSPTKLYHNGILFVGYGYVAVSAYVADLAGGQWLVAIVALIPGLVWFGLAQFENRSMVKNPDLRLSKAAGAHIPDWRPIWR